MGRGRRHPLMVQAGRPDWWPGASVCLLMALTVLSSRGRGQDAEENAPPSRFGIHPGREVSLVPGGELRVYVWEAAVDPEGEPVTYTFRLLQGGPEGAVILERSGLTHTFLLLDLASEAPEWDGVSEPLPRVTATDPAGASTSGILLTGPSGASDSDADDGVSLSGSAPGYLWGYVHDSLSGRPVVGAVVETPTGSIVTEDGVYGLSVPPGTFTLNVLGLGYVTYSTEVTVDPGETVLLNVGLLPAEDREEGYVYGRVLDWATDKPVRRTAVVTVGDEVMGVPADGSYVVRLPAGNYNLKVEATGYETFIGQVVVEADARRNVDVVLRAIRPQVWLRREGYDLAVDLSGVNGLYDVYVVATIYPPGELYSLVGLEPTYAAEGKILPLGRDVPLGSGTYRLRVVDSPATDRIEGVDIHFLLTRTGISPIEGGEWEVYDSLRWSEDAADPATKDAGTGAP